MHDTTQLSVIGSFDELHPVRPAPHRDGILLRAGEQAVVRGWIATRDERKVRRVFIDIAGRRQPLEYGFRRPDVVEKFGTGALHSGYEGRFDVPSDVNFNTDVLLHCLTSGEGGGPEDAVLKASVYVVRPAEPVAPRPTRVGARSRVRRLADMHPGEPLFGRSRLNVRPGAVVEISGWILDRIGRGAGDAVGLMIRGADDVNRFFETQRTFDGEAAVSAGTDLEAGFRALIDLATFPPGLASVTPLIRETDGVWTSGAPAMFECSAAGSHAPLFLPFFKQPLSSCLEVLEPRDIFRGQPVCVSGWAVDPLAGGQGKGVYARFDDRRFLPLPSGLDRPSIAAAQGLRRADIGFAGIVDSTSLTWGEHRLDIALYDSLGCGWYAIASEAIVVRS